LQGKTLPPLLHGGNIAQLTNQGTLLNHANTTSTMNNEFQRELIALQDTSKIDFVLSEIGNTIGSSGNHTADLELAASLGAAVWTVDWMLYAMTMVRIST
jgi:hypothetical protein